MTSIFIIKLHSGQTASRDFNIHPAISAVCKDTKLMNPFRSLCTVIVAPQRQRYSLCAKGLSKLGDGVIDVLLEGVEGGG